MSVQPDTPAHKAERATNVTNSIIRNRAKNLLTQCPSIDFACSRCGARKNGMHDPPHTVKRTQLAAQLIKLGVWWLLNTFTHHQYLLKSFVIDAVENANCRDAQ